MIWAIVFQFLTAFIFIILFFTDIHLDRGEVSKRRFFLALLGFALSSFILGVVSLFVPRSECALFILNSLMTAIFRMIGDFLKEPGWQAGLVTACVILINIPFWFLGQFPGFLIFWMWFSRNKKLRIFAMILCLLWSVISLWLCMKFPISSSR